MIESLVQSKPKQPTSLRNKIIITAILAGLGKWFDYRLKVEKLRADAGYAAVAPVIKEMQNTVVTLSAEVQLLKQLVLVQQQQERDAHPVTTKNAALDTFSNKLVVKVQKSQGVLIVPQKQLPSSLDDAVQTTK